MSCKHFDAPSRAVSSHLPSMQRWKTAAPGIGSGLGEDRAMRDHELLTVQ